METTSCHRCTISRQKYILLSSDNYFIQAVLRKRGHCLRLVRYCVQDRLGESKIQIDLLSLDPFSGRRVDAFNENLSKIFFMVS